MNEPILILELGNPPPSGNVMDRMSWKAEYRLNKNWRERVVVAARGQGFPPPEEGKKRKLVIHWTAPRPPDCVNALRALKSTVEDNLRRRVQRKILGLMKWIKGPVPVLWDDDPDHCLIEYRPQKGSPRNLIVEIWET